MEIMEAINERLITPTGAERSRHKSTGSALSPFACPVQHEIIPSMSSEYAGRQDLVYDLEHCTPEPNIV
jgi:hypothetical protein